jgi:hypothetical protein
MLVKHRRDEVLPAWELLLAMAFFVSGYFLHYVADAQVRAQPGPRVEAGSGRVEGSASCHVNGVG